MCVCVCVYVCVRACVLARIGIIVPYHYKLTSFRLNGFASGMLGNVSPEKHEIPLSKLTDK